MKSMFKVFPLAIAILIGTVIPLIAQENEPPASPPTSQETAEQAAEQAADQEKSAPVTEQIGDKVNEVSDMLNRSEEVKKVSAGILQPIYEAAEYIGFPMFYFVAFMLMVAGVVSFAGQLFLAKLFLLLRGSLNIKEILADTMGLLISVVGLILTTQAATENSDFTQNPVMVVSATVLGAVLGLLCYWWGQSQEFWAARGRAIPPLPRTFERPKM